MQKLTAQIVKTHELAQRDIDCWRELMRQSPFLESAFCSYPYTATAARVFYSVRVAKLMLGSETIGFFPFQYRSPLHRLLGWGQRLGGELADSFGIVAKPELQLSTVELMRLCRLNALYFTHLDESQTRFGLSGEKPEMGLRIECPDGGTAFWEVRNRLDRKFTADTERRERKLIEEFGPLKFVFRHVDAPAELERLIAAKRGQYERTGAADSLGRKSVRDFLYALSGSTDPDCCATLSTLHAGDRWVGSHFGLMCGSTLHYWFPVYNPYMRSFAPGRLLLKAIIDTSGETGVRAIDRGAGDSPSKRDFATSEHRYLRGVWTQSGVASLAYRAGLSLAWRLKAIHSDERQVNGHASVEDSRHGALESSRKQL